MGSALNIGISGLRAAQIAMDVTSHNIANVNTPNFQREVTDFTEVSFPNSPIPNGSGVTVSNVHTINDPILTSNYSNALSNSSEYNKLSELSKPFDALVHSPALNLSTAMQDTFNAFQDVANTPTSIPVRQNAINQSQNLVDKSKNLMSEIGDLKVNLTNGLNQNVQDVNNIVSNIASINQQLQSSPTNSSLSSQRDSLTLDLSKLTGVTVSPDKMNITTTSGKNLLQNGITVNPLTTQDLPSITGGSIGGTNKFITTILNNVSTQLPAVIQNFATQVNTQATKGYDLNGQQGNAIFNSPNATLSDFSVAISDPKTLGASSSATGHGDGSNAQKISDIKNEAFAGQTLQNQYTGTVVNLDNKVKSYEDMKNGYDNTTSDFSTKLHNMSGVNLDEEAANLLKYKQMYQANAQVIKTQEEMFATLINIKV